MKLKVGYQRVSGGRSDIVVVTEPNALVGDVARELLLRDPKSRTGPEYPVTLSVSRAGHEAFRQLDPDRAIGDSPVASGWVVQVEPFEGVPADPASLAIDVSVIDGPDAGRKVSLGPGTHELGRDKECRLVLSDPMVSRRHARIDVHETIEMVDLNSANGVMVDGGLVSRLELVHGQVVTLGDTELRVEIRMLSGRRAPDAVAGGIPVNRPPRVEGRYPGSVFPVPDVPTEADKPPFPWMLMLAPVALAAVAYFASNGNSTSLIFMAMSPMMMLANYVAGRQRTKRQSDSQVGRFLTQIETLRHQLESEVPVERAARLSEAPSSSSVLQAVLERDPLMWTRRPEHWSFLHVRFGCGDAPSRNSVATRAGLARGIPRYAEDLDELVASHRDIVEVPIVEDPFLAGAIGVVGRPEVAAGLARALLTQWVGLHSPAELIVTAVVGPGEVRDYEWLKWLPHTSSLSSPISGPHLTDSPTSSSALLAQLEELVSQRATGPAHRPSAAGAPDAMLAGARVGENEVELPPLPVVLLVVTDLSPVDRGRLTQLAESAPDAGIVILNVAEKKTGLLGACRTFADLSEGLGSGSVNFVRYGHVVSAVAFDSVSLQDATAMAIAMAPYVDHGAVGPDTSDLPRTVPMLGLLGGIADSPASVIDRWLENHSLHEGEVKPRSRTSGLRAIVGSAGNAAMHLDLRADGPHALVGGTTGAGKSEFLQAWVLGMAAEFSPQRVTFLFVDYKGGAAFADCVRLPHCVGLVTDLSPHLVRRALTSLRAELRRREHLLNAKKAKDLLALEKRGDPDCPPALVIVIDEFAALATDVPEFVDGVVDVAQRGRSLGIHLIMATQRPAGVIKDNLRANTNLRIALRMADESDSTDVLGAVDAAGFDSTVPGRAVAKKGPGRLVPFQSAYAGGWSDAVADKPEIDVHELRFGADTAWNGDERGAGPEPDRGQTDLARLVETITAASSYAQLSAPRRPWLNELKATYDLAAFGPRTDTELILGMADLPEQQEQRPVVFHPDADGHLIAFGSGGSGKTVLLRTVAAGAGITPRGGPVHVYGLDFAAGGLRMLEVLPHVGSIVAGDDEERVVRLMRRLKQEVDRRADAYSRTGVDSIVGYRKQSGITDEPRILLLIDGYPTFRSEYEGIAGRQAAYATLQQLLLEGRQLGIHVVLTADRPASVPGSVSSAVPRRLVLRLADDSMYGVLDVPKDVFDVVARPGQAVVDQAEVQVAVFGGSATTADQARALAELARGIEATGRVPAPPVAAMPLIVQEAELPDRLGDAMVLGISDSTLEPTGMAPEGVLLVAGPPGSGRSNAVRALARSFARRAPSAPRYHLTFRRSQLAASTAWSSTASGVDDCGTLASKLKGEFALTEIADGPALVVIESLSDVLGTAAEGPVTDLIKAIRRSGHLLIAEAETGAWSGGWAAAPMNEIKAARRGLILQPDQVDAESLLKTAIGRVGRNEFPPGRGIFVEAGRYTKVQLPFVSG